MPLDAAEPAATSLLLEFEALRCAARASVASWWYPMVAFGLVAVGGALADAAGGWVPAVWWPVALVSAMVVTARFYRRRSVDLGAVPRYRRYWALWLPITAGAFVLPALVPARAAPVTAWLLVAVGYLIMAGLARSARMGITGGLIAGVGVAGVTLAAPAVASDLLCGLILMASGLSARAHEARAARGGDVTNGARTGDAAPAPPHPVLGLDDVVHQRVRLGILCVLYEIDRAEFIYLRQLLELSDGNLARHLAVLVDAGLVELTKDRQGPRSRTWATLTAAGKRAFRDEVDRLDRIVRAHQTQPQIKDGEPDANEPERRGQSDRRGHRPGDLYDDRPGDR